MQPLTLSIHIAKHIHTQQQTQLAMLAITLKTYLNYLFSNPCTKRKVMLYLYNGRAENKRLYLRRTTWR